MAEAAESTTRAPEEGQTPPTPPAPNLPPEVLEQLRRGAERNGGYEDFAKILYDDNKSLRDSLRDLKGQLPGENTAVLPKADADALKRLRAAAKEAGMEFDVDTVATELKNLPTYKEKIRNADRSALIAKHAAKDGQQLYKPHVLTELLANQEIAEKDGKLVIGAEGAQKPLETWLEEDKKDFLPSVLVSAGTPALGGVGKRNGKGSNVQSVISGFQAERDARPNPLAKIAGLTPKKDKE